MNRAKGLIGALAFVLFVASGTAAAAGTDISGPWMVTVEFPGNKSAIEVIIKQDDEKIAAEVAGFSFSGTLVDGKITAVYPLQMQGNSLDIKMRGIVEPDGTLSGTIEFSPGQELKWTAVRKPAGDAPAAESPAAAQPIAPEAPDSAK